MNQARIDKANILIGNVKHDWWANPKITVKPEITQPDVKMLFAYRENLSKTIVELKMSCTKKDYQTFSDHNRLLREYIRVDKFLTDNFYKA